MPSKMVTPSKKLSSSSWQVQWAQALQRAALEREQLGVKQEQERRVRERSDLIDRLVEKVGPIPQSLRDWLMDLSIHISTDNIRGWYFDQSCPLTLNGLKGCNVDDVDDYLDWNFCFDLGDLTDSRQWEIDLKRISNNNLHTNPFFPRPSDVAVQMCKLCQLKTRNDDQWAQLVSLTGDNKALAILACYFAAVGRCERQAIAQWHQTFDGDDE